MNQLRTRVPRACAAVVAAVTAAVAMNPAPAHAATGPVAVSLTFDDALTSQYRLAPTLAAHGVRATFYLNSGAIDTRGGFGTMSWAWAQELAAAGHEVGGHTLDHVDLMDPAVTAEEKQRQVCDDRARLVEQGFQPTSFAFPGGNFDAAAQQIVQDCGYQSARLAGGLSSSGPRYAERIPPRLGNYTVQVLGTTDNGPITLDALTSAVQAAYEHGGGWLPILFHAVCYPGTSNYDTCMASYRPVDATVVDKFLSWTEDHGGIAVRPFSEVLANGIPSTPMDTTAPSVAITKPAADSSVGAAKPSIGGTAGTARGDLGSVAVSVYSGGAATGTPVQTLTASVSPNGAWTATPAALSDGTYTVRATQKDTAGNTGTSTAVTFTVDTVGPKVAVTAPAANSTSKAAKPEIAGTAGTSPGDSDSVSIGVYAGKAATGTPAQTLSASVAGDGTWAVTPAALADGTYTVRATQKDAAGNTGTSTAVTFTVDTKPAPPPDTTAPEVSVTAPSSGSTSTTASPKLMGKAGTATGDRKSVGVSVYSGGAATGTPVQSLTASVGSDGTWSVTPAALADGTYTVRATQKDDSGNTGLSKPVTFAVEVKSTPEVSRPELSGLSRSVLGQGARGARIVMTGSFDDTTQVRAGRGVRARVVRRSAESLVVRVTVGSRAATGARTVRVVNGDGGAASCARCLRVVPGPKIKALMRSTLVRGRVTWVPIRGTHFTRNTVVRVGGKGVRVKKVRFIGPRKIKVAVATAQRARRTARSVTLLDTRTLGRDFWAKSLRVR
jgi:peptidoglycan/xylan/chitin deacetylase (PgdA/CDA1 family)